MFFLLAILFVIAFPLAVPVTVTIVHAISNWRQSTGAVRRPTAGAVRPVFAPAPQGAVAVAV